MITVPLGLAPDVTAAAKALVEDQWRFIQQNIDTGKSVDWEYGAADLGMYILDVIESTPADTDLPKFLVGISMALIRHASTAPFGNAEEEEGRRALGLATFDVLDVRAKLAAEAA